MKINLTPELIQRFKNMDANNKFKFKKYLLSHDLDSYYELIWLTEVLK